MKILVVDDEPDIRLLLEKYLSRSGHEVMAVSSPEEAEWSMGQGCFHLVISDIRMPGGNGLDLLSRLKAANPTLDVIMLTGYGDMDSSIEALRRGASNYLLKPIRLQDLNLAVNTVAKRLALERRLAEQARRLDRAEKMADLGRVAAGVAHEINNPNTFIRGNVQTLKKFWPKIEEFIRRDGNLGESPPDIRIILGEMPAILDEMLKGADRIAAVVQNLSCRIREEQACEVTPLDLNRCVRTACDRVQTDGRGVPVVLDLAESLVPIRAREDDLVEAVFELCRNSLASLTGSPSPRLNLVTRPHSPYMAAIEVFDNGPGIPEQVLPHIFSPFIGDSPQSGRSGLGLSKVYSLVRGFGGDIDCRNEAGLGACFRITVPTFDQFLPQGGAE